LSTQRGRLALSDEDREETLLRLQRLDSKWVDALDEHPGSVSRRTEHRLRYAVALASLDTFQPGAARLGRRTERPEVQVRSPRLREDEVLAFAKSRNVCDEVLRALADNRDWTRSYPVKLALVSNPKCPQPKAMQFLNHLQERDLRQVARSKDVPAATAAHARRLLDRRGQRR